MEIIPDRDRPNNNVAQSGQKWSEGRGGVGRREEEEEGEWRELGRSREWNSNELHCL